MALSFGGMGMQIGSTTWSIRGYEAMIRIVKEMANLGAANYTTWHVVLFWWFQVVMASWMDPFFRVSNLQEDFLPDSLIMRQRIW